MIIRILGEGQYEVSEKHLDTLNAHDDRLTAALRAGDADTFGRELRALLAAVRELGTPVPDTVLTTSDMVVPDADADLARVRTMLRDDGLIPG
jgi:hypothetical protein